MTLAQAVDKAVLQTVNQVMRCKQCLKTGDDCKNCKLDLLDQLYLNVLNNHPDGLGAKVLQTISDKQTEVMYPNHK